MKIAEWIKSSPAGQYHLYFDYLRFCQSLGYDMTDRSILFPKDIKTAHDREMKRFQIVQNAEKDAAVEKRYQKDLMIHGYHAQGYLIRPPVDIAEIINEGAALHHCVGTYADQVATGKTTILLVRKQAKPEESLYTVEWRDGRMIQCRGDHNKAPTPEVAEFIQAWQDRSKKKIKQKTRVMATAAV